MARGLQSVTPGTDVVPQPELERTEFFNDFLMRYGITDLTMMPACVDRKPH